MNLIYSVTTIVISKPRCICFEITQNRRQLCMTYLIGVCLQKFGASNQTEITAECRNAWMSGQQKGIETWNNSYEGCTYYIFNRFERGGWLKTNLHFELVACREVITLKSALNVVQTNPAIHNYLRLIKNNE